MEKFVSKNGVSVKAHKGDAMTLLAMSLDESITENFTGFSILVKPPERFAFYLFNRFCYEENILKKSKIDPAKVNIYSSKYAPIQKFRWVHTPATNHNINDWIFGEYLYEITPRYMIDDVLQPLDKSLTITIPFEISPYKKGNFQIGFTRGFIESQAYSRHFGLNNKTRPNTTDLIFDIQAKSGPADKDKKANPALADYTFEDQYRWMGWQARECIVEMLDEILNDRNLSVDVFAFDLNEPLICASLVKLAIDGRARIILDNSPEHVKPAAMETKFDKLFTENEKTTNSLVRGHFKSLSHSKVFIQKRKGRPEKVLTGSTNFSTNGLYINANHVLVFKDKKIAELYSSVFEISFGQSLMDKFRGTDYSTNEFKFSGRNLPKTLIRFSPHPIANAENFFALISQRILSAKTDVLFAIMKDNSKSTILDAVMEQVQSDKVFTYGITDVIGDKTKIYLYKPDSKRGVRVAGKPGQFILPPPFEKESSIPGISIHHKFVVVDFKGKDPVVYCGSSNLAFGPEQKNGDNLIQIRDKDAVTAFAVEAIRLVDHFHFRNAQFIEQQSAKDKKPVLKPVFLRASKDKKWVDAYYNKNDLLYMERTLLIK